MHRQDPAKVARDDLRPENDLRLVPILMRAEMARFRHDPWGTDLVRSLTSGSPRFRAVWEATQREPTTASAARAPVPVRLRVPGAGLLSFHLSSEPFSLDARFRVIYLFPADPRTMRQCAAWADLADDEDRRVT